MASSRSVDRAMPTALLTLIALHGRAMVRRTLRGVRTGRGASVVALGGLATVVWIASGFFGSRAARTDPETVRTMFPVWLLTICVLNLLTSAGERAIAFTPPEVDFLFAGPFTRRQLLGYKLLKSVAGASVTATLFSLLFFRYLQSWAAGWVGILFSLLFLHMVSMAVVLLGETLTQHVGARGRRTLIAVLIAATAIAIVPALHAARGRSAADIGAAFASTAVGRFVLAPFAIFGDVVTATRLVPDALTSVVLGALVLALLTMLLMWLDAQYLESAARAGHQAHARIERMRRGGVIAWMSAPGAREGRLRIPLPPRLAGVGPIAWRQLTTAIRQSRAVVMLLLVLCVALGPMLYIAGAANDRDPIALLISIVFSMNALFANALRFDFRGDIEQLDMLKSLPLPPTAIVVAQLVAPTVVLTLCQGVLFIGIGVFLHVDVSVLLAAALATVPLNALVFAIENALFLHFPARIWAASPGDVQGTGRRMAIFLLKTMILLIACGVAAGVGRTASRLAGQSAVAFVVASAGVLALEAAALLPLMTAAFRRFDPSADTPL